MAATVAAVPARLMIPVLMQVYGIIAVQAAYRDYDTGNSVSDDNLGGMQLNNESRIGLSGDQSRFVLDLGSYGKSGGGYVDPSFGGEGAGLGERDTFVGFESDSLGQIPIRSRIDAIVRIGGLASTSNPGLGDVWDWGGAIGGAKYQDRQSNTIRWDSPLYADALTFDVAVGAGDKLGGEGDDY